MHNYAGAEDFSSFRTSLFRFSELWNPENECGSVKDVLALGGSWVAIIYTDPEVDGPVGFVIDLNNFGAELGEEIGIEGVAQEVLQSFIFDPSGQGRTSNHPRLRAIAETFPGVTWHGGFQNLLLP